MMKKFAFLSATALLLAACAANEVQFPGVSSSPVLNISNSSGSFVGKKVNEFTREYNSIHSSVNSSAQKLAQINQSIAEADSEYNAVINTIEAKLQAGTTPSNPDLVSALNKAQENLGTLENGTQKLASVASEVAAQQENTNADLMAAVKADMADEQSKAQQFRAEITRLNVDVAAGYVNKTAAAVSYDSRTNFKTIKPVQIKKELAKDKSVRTNKKRVKLGKKFGVIENTPKTASAKKAAPKTAAVKVSSAKKATPQSVQKALNTAAPQQAKTIAEPVKPIAGTIFSKDFPDDNVEYYAELRNAVQNALKNNPDARFEVVAIMPMDTAAQERIQNVTAQIFGDMLTMSVPAENLQVSARSKISKKTPTVAVIKK